MSVIISHDCLDAATSRVLPAQAAGAWNAATSHHAETHFVPSGLHHVSAPGSGAIAP